MELLDLGRLAVALAACILASYSDWTTRLASDRYWQAMGLAGLAFIAVDVLTAGANLAYLLFLIPIGVIFFDLFWDRKGMLEDGLNLAPIVLYALSILIIAALFLLLGSEQLFWELFVIVLMIFVFFVLYQFDIIKGGADAKALMAIAVLLPVYPLFDGLPLIHVPTDLAMLAFPFSLLVLFDAALLSVVIPILLLFLNAVRRDAKFPAMLLGYRMDVAEARKKFVWPMERLAEGKIRFVYFPRDEDNDAQIYDELEASGVKRIWVTPKIPFLIPITASIVFSVIVGNIIFAFVH